MKNCYIILPGKREYFWKIKRIFKANVKDANVCKRYNCIPYYIDDTLDYVWGIITIAGLYDRAKCTDLGPRWLVFCWKTINAYTVTEIHQPENWFAALVVKTQWWRWYMIALNKLSCHGPFPVFIFKLPMVFDVACNWSSTGEKFIFFFQRVQFPRRFILHYWFYVFVKSATATEAIRCAYFYRFLIFIEYLIFYLTFN